MEAFADAYAEYWRTGVVPTNAGELLFLATWASGGAFPRELSRQHGTPFDSSSYMGFSDDLLSALDPAEAARGLASEGYYVAPDRLSEEVVDDIVTVLEAGPAEPRGKGNRGSEGAPNAAAPTWWIRPEDALRSAGVRRLLRERRLAEVGGKYLQVDPMVMSIALWKSFPWYAADGHSAQLFHYDNDRAGFVKMFVYLCDVSPENGPHTYVPRSHREKPRGLLHGDRLPDEAVARFYPKRDWVSITGAKGTVFFADTQGFHKGAPVQAGDRSIVQINLATDRFGSSDPALGSAQEAPVDLTPYVSIAPRYFSQYFGGEHLRP
jgi:hypothetical protein